MATTVTYPFSVPYRNVPGAGFMPAVEVELYYGAVSARTVGVFDSGSPYTVFGVQFAEALGIDDVTAGERVPVRTLGGSVEFFLFDMDIALRIGGETLRFPGRIGFFAGPSPRNILGRIVVFTRFELGFKEHAQQVHIRPEE
jgi:hypothetical protein